MPNGTGYESSDQHSSVQSIDTVSVIGSLPSSYSSWNGSIVSSKSVDSPTPSVVADPMLSTLTTKPPTIDGVLVRKRKIWHQEYYKGPYNGGLQFKVKAEEVNVTRAQSTGYKALPPYAPSKQLYQYTVPANHVRYCIPNKVKMTQDHLTYDVASQFYRFLIDVNGWPEQEAHEVVYKDVVSLVQVAGVRCLDIYWSSKLPSPTKHFQLFLQGHQLQYIGAGSDLFKTHFTLLISNVPRTVNWDDLQMFIKVATGELQEQGYEKGPKRCLGHWTEVWQQVRCRQPEEPKVLLSNFVVLCQANEEMGKRLHEDPLSITAELQDIPSVLSCGTLQSIEIKHLGKGVSM